MRSACTLMALFNVVTFSFSASAQYVPDRIQAPIDRSWIQQETPFWIRKGEIPPLFQFFDDVTASDKRAELEVKILNILKKNICRNDLAAVRTEDLKTGKEKIEQKPCNEFLFSTSNIHNKLIDLFPNLVAGDLMNQFSSQYPELEKDMVQTERYFNMTNNPAQLVAGDDRIFGSVAYTKISPQYLAKNFDGTPKADTVAELVFQTTIRLGCTILGRKEHISLMPLSEAIIEIIMPSAARSVYANIPELKKAIQNSAHEQFIIKTNEEFLGANNFVYGAPFGTNGDIYGSRRNSIRLIQIYGFKSVYVFDSNQKTQVISALNEILRCR